MHHNHQTRNNRPWYWSGIPCYARSIVDTLKYLILQSDCKLYSQWDDPASLIF